MDPLVLELAQKVVKSVDNIVQDIKNIRTLTLPIVMTITSTVNHL